MNIMQPGHYLFAAPTVNNFNAVIMPINYLRRALNIMKLIVILLIVSCLQSNAKGNINITITGKDLPLEKVFEEIQKQTGYNILITRVTVNGIDLTKKGKNELLEEILKGYYQNQPLGYSMDGKVVLVKAMNKKSNTCKCREKIRNTWMDERERVTNEESELVNGTTIRGKGIRKNTYTNGKGSLVVDKVEGVEIFNLNGIPAISVKSKWNKYTSISCSCSINAQVIQVENNLSEQLTYTNRIDPDHLCNHEHISFVNPLIHRYPFHLLKKPKEKYIHYRRLENNATIPALGKPNQQYNNSNGSICIINFISGPLCNKNKVLNSGDLINISYRHFNSNKPGGASTLA